MHPLIRRASLQEKLAPSFCFPRGLRFGSRESDRRRRWSFGGEQRRWTFEVLSQWLMSIARVKSSCRRYSCSCIRPI